MTSGLRPGMQNWDLIKALYKLRQYGYSIYGLHFGFDSIKSLSCPETLRTIFFKDPEWILSNNEWGNLQMFKPWLKPTIAVRDSVPNS